MANLIEVFDKLGKIYNDGVEENDNKSNDLYVCDGKYTDYGMLYHAYRSLCSTSCPM